MGGGGKERVKERGNGSGRGTGIKEGMREKGGRAYFVWEAPPFITPSTQRVEPVTADLL